MASVPWLIVLFTGLLVAIRSSRWAVGHLADFATATRIPPFIVGITLVSFGTDLPEIANSIASSVTGHGDINVGDSVGSATVQATLIIGLMPFIAGAFPFASGTVARVGAATFAALLGGALLMIDGHVSRIDAVLLVLAWLAGTLVAWRHHAGATPPVPHPDPSGRGRHLLLALIGLALVGAGATTAVEALTQLSTIWSVPEYYVAFFLASVGTSLPELVVISAALRRQEWDLAIGDALGSSFVDSTISIAAGPLIAPISVTAATVVTGSLVAAVSVAVSTVLLATRGRHDRRSGVALIVVFVVAYVTVSLIG
jgi:cation:H+ antiporter